MDHSTFVRRCLPNVVTPFDVFDYEQPLREVAARLEGASNVIIPLVGLEAGLTLLKAADMAEAVARVLALAQLVRECFRVQRHEVIGPDGPDGPGEHSGTTRVSSHFENTEADISRLLDGLERVLREDAQRQRCS